MGFHTDLGTADAGCTTSRGPMVRRLPLLQHGVVGGLTHTSLITGEPRARHLGSEQGISHPPSGGAVPDVPCLDGQVRTVPPVTDGSGIRRRLPRSGPGYCGPSTASVLTAVDYIMQYDTMLSNSFAPAGKPALPVPAVAQYRVDFLSGVNSVASKTPRADGASAVDGGVPASEEK